MKLTLAVVIASLALVGCGSTGVLPVGNASALPKPEGCQVAVFDSEEDVGRPFEKLCIIDAKTGSTLYNDRSVSGAMKRVNAAACQCGADAVIVKAMGKQGVSAWDWGSSKVSVVAIRYTGPAEASPAGSD
ncbi:MAG TPA: hypothetical protein PLP50_07870 [Thermoanaerobaculia bacterium]|jgi:hypothetical protein|nr:hypothetical protein [Thermoanaerobaculia bacterium]HQN08610.1 hypothetical protein [Thermoanaerobaculia bacterium]HQP85767.1 hypothetical protein [Thermoanaerobaculia bacterium]